MVVVSAPEEVVAVGSTLRLGTGNTEVVEG